MDLFRLEETDPLFFEPDRDFDLDLDSFTDCERDLEAFFFDADRETDFFFCDEFDRDLDFPSLGDFDFDFDFDRDRESEPSFASFFEDSDRSAVFLGEGDRDWISTSRRGFFRFGLSSTVSSPDITSSSDGMNDFLYGRLEI